MNRGVWIGALVAGLGGWLGGLGAQESVWRTTARPAPPATVRAARADEAAPALGRPIAVARGASDADPPPPLPPAYQPGLQLSDQAGAAEPIAIVPTPGSVIAASNAPKKPAAAPAAPPAPPADEVLPADLFATERKAAATGGAVPAVYPGPPGLTPEAQPEVIPVANWVEPYPANQIPVPPGPFPGFEAEPPPPPRFYVRGEYLLWWIRPDHAPPLVTTGDAQLGAQAGVLGGASTVVLDNGNLTNNPQSGGRFFAGLYLDDCGSKAIEVGGFFLGQTSRNFTASSAQFPVITRPIFNLNQGVQSFEATAFPGLGSGTINVNSPTNLGGLESNLRCKLCCCDCCGCCNYTVFLLGGFRYLSLNEGLTITEDIQGLPTTPPPLNTHFQVVDSFTTNDQFYGPQVGIDGRVYYGRFSLDGFAKVAAGVTEQTVNINGFFSFPPGTPNVDPRPGGLLALNSNIGHYTRSQFSVVPEVGLNLGYNITDRLRASVGYNFLYWTNVVRPGEQVDTNIDITRIPNAGPLPPGVTPLAGNHPGVLFRESDFWAQGITFGLQYTY
jgi:hypothetical protein